MQSQYRNNLAYPPLGVVIGRDANGTDEPYRGTAYMAKLFLTVPKAIFKHA